MNLLCVFNAVKGRGFVLGATWLHIYYFFYYLKKIVFNPSNSEIIFLIFRFATGFSNLKKNPVARSNGRYVVLLPIFCT